MDMLRFAFFVAMVVGLFMAALAVTEKAREEIGEIQKVKRGRWDNGFCSVCGEEALTEWNDTGGEYAFTPYCPHCGARMDLDEAE